MSKIKGMGGSFLNGTIVLFILSLFIYFIFTRYVFVHGFSKSDWLRRVNRSLGNKNDGKFLAKDRQGDYVTLEWSVARNKDEYKKFLAEISDFCCLSRIDVQLSFWQKHPEGCPESLKVFFSDDVNLTNLDQVKESVVRLGKLDFSPDFSDKDDIVFFVKLYYKKSNKLFGAAIFGIGGDYDYGDVFIRDIVAKPEARDRGLGKLMASSIFKIVPDVKRVGVYVLDTNKNGSDVYSYWDFTKEQCRISNCKKACIFMAYNIERSKSLQLTAASLKSAV